MWRKKAKVADDWASFEPYIDRIVASLKRQAAYLDDTRDPYDVWLDQYERGINCAAFDRFFDQVRETVVPLVQAIGERAASSPRCLSSPRTWTTPPSARCPST